MNTVLDSEEIKDYRVIHTHTHLHTSTDTNIYHIAGNFCRVKFLQMVHFPKFTDEI